MTESIAHYRIGAKLGQGAMGAVYRATDTKLGRDVAIKLLTATGGDASAGLASVFAASAPRPLFQLPREFLLQTQTPGGIADLSRDHQRLYLSNVPPDLTRREIDVILNWQAAGRR